MRLVVVGGGHAGVEVCAAVRRAGFDGPITLIDEQDTHPYQRPPLSKDSFVGEAVEVLPLQPREFFDKSSIRFIRGRAVVRIDRDQATVVLDDDEAVAYDHLVLATGAQSVTADFLGAGVPVHVLRTDRDASNLAHEMTRAQRILVIGAGFIGLEVAAASRARGADVVVVSPGERVLSRSVSPQMSAVVRDRLEGAGIEIRLLTDVRTLSPLDVGARATFSDGSTQDVDAVVVGIGVRPRTQLAEEAGLLVEDGIVVNERLQTSDERIWAVGDCARFPSVYSGRSERLESVQNATDQARHVASSLLGGNAPYANVPWFWSVQGPLRLQIAGLGSSEDEVLLPAVDRGAEKLSAFRFRDGRLACVESLNDSPTHMAARRALSLAYPPTRDALVAADFDLRALIPRPAP